jgi:hypothetical protein
MTAEIEEALVERGRLRHIRENVVLDGAHGFFGGASVVPVDAFLDSECAT